MPLLTGPPTPPTAGSDDAWRAASGDAIDGHALALQAGTAWVEEPSGEPSLEGAPRLRSPTAAQAAGQLESSRAALELAGRLGLVS